MYKVSEHGEGFTIEEDDEPLTTPGGRLVRTTYRALADRLRDDLETYGDDPSDPVSLVAFHYAMIDFFADMSRLALERNVASGLERENDWTFSCPTATPEPMMKWMGLFGTHSSQASDAEEWLSTLNRMQLCAGCVLGRAIESVNIPYIVATRLSSADVGDYAEEVSNFYPYADAEELAKYFENFLFYFSLEAPPEAKQEKARKGRRAAARR